MFTRCAPIDSVDDVIHGVDRQAAGGGDATVLSLAGHAWSELFAASPGAQCGLDPTKPAVHGSRSAYGLTDNDAKPHVHSTDPTKPINSFKESWESAKDASGVSCRFHDLRHSPCTRLVESGVPLPVIASLLGWSAGTTVRMARRYGHISAEAQRKAVEHLKTETVGPAAQSVEDDATPDGIPQ